MKFIGGFEKTAISMRFIDKHLESGLTSRLAANRLKEPALNKLKKTVQSKSLKLPKSEMEKTWGLKNERFKDLAQGTRDTLRTSVKDLKSALPKKS